MNSPATVEEWIAYVEARKTCVGIIGLGYVGLPLALLFSEAGFRVTGFDIDSEKVAALNSGRSYIHRIPPEEIAAARVAGFRATADFAEAHACDAILICVPTPLAANHEPDMSFVTGTVETLAPHTCSGQLIVLESTTWPGATTELVVPTLERLGPPNTQLLVAFSPEREDPGNTTTPRRAIPKVIGGVDQRAAQAAAALYGAIFNRTVVVSSTEAAEMTKLLENIYRGVNIALVNELKQLCLAMGIDIWEVIDAAATKPFGFAPFYPGPGIGGHCIPVDPFYLAWRARQFDRPTRFIELAGEVNEAMPAFVVRTIEEALSANMSACQSKNSSPRHRLQARCRRSPRVSRAHYLPAASRGRRKRRLQRSVLSDRRRRPPLFTANALHAAWRGPHLRLRGASHRSLRL